MMGRSFDSLPLPVRAQRYREMAEEALRLTADAATPELKGSYLNLAASWHSLAMSMENELGAEAEQAADSIIRNGKRVTGSH